MQSQINLVRIYAKLCLSLLLAVISTLACSSSRDRYSPGTSVPPPLAERVAIPSSDQGDRLPWESWALGRDLSGRVLSDRMLLEGDEYLRRGERQQALRIFRAIDARRLAESEREVLALRISTCELGLDQPKQALQTLSDFFRASGKSEQDVSPSISLIFAYAYGRLGDIDQSLAWFARVYRIGRSQGYSEAAATGVRLLGRRIDDSSLYSLSERWKSESFVHRIFGEERRRRLRPEYIPISGASPFWSSEAYNVVPGLATATLPESHTVIGVVLPLSGPFGALGRSAKQGIELAVEGQALRQTSLEIRDDSGDNMQSLSAVRELAGQQQVALVLGPLLSEVAVEAGQVMRSFRKPILSFARSGDISQGAGVYRLGPTAESQVTSLINVLSGQHGTANFERLAVVYPDDPSGAEFAEIFIRRVKDLGYQIAFEASYRKDDVSSLFAITKEIRARGIQAVFLPDSLRMAARFFSYLNVGGAPYVRPIGTASWDSLSELQQSRAVLEGAIFVSPFHRSEERIDAERFVQSYKARFGTEPDFLAAQGFDAATIVLESMRRASNNNTSFDNALRSIGSYNGLTGTIFVRPNGALERQFNIVRFSEGQIRDLSVRTAATESINQEYREPSQISVDHESSFQSNRW